MEYRTVGLLLGFKVNFVSETEISFVAFILLGGCLIDKMVLMLF